MTARTDGRRWGRGRGPTGVSCHIDPGGWCPYVVVGEGA